MHLFHPKIIAKHAKPAPIPADHLSLIENWIKQIDNGTLLNLNEMQVQGAFTQQILCKLLGYQAVGERVHHFHLVLWLPISGYQWILIYA